MFKDIKLLHNMKCTFKRKFDTKGRIYYISFDSISKTMDTIVKIDFNYRKLYIYIVIIFRLLYVLSL